MWSIAFLRGKAPAREEDAADTEQNSHALRSMSTAGRHGYGPPLAREVFPLLWLHRVQRLRES